MNARLYQSLGLITVVNIALVMWNSAMVPQGLIPFLIGAGFVPIGTAILVLKNFKGRPATERMLLTSMIGAGVMIGGSLFVSAITEAGWVPEAPAERTIGIALGLAMMLSGNFMPKMTLPLSEIGSAAPACDRKQRRVGRIQTVAGATMVVACIVLPSHWGPFAILIIGLSSLIPMVAWPPQRLARRGP